MKPRVYLDTTVPSAYFDRRTPDRQRLTKQFWAESLPKFEPAISTVVLLEIRDTPAQERRKEIEDLVSGFEVLRFE